MGARHHHPLTNLTVQAEQARHRIPLTNPLFILHPRPILLTLPAEQPSARPTVSGEALSGAVKATDVEVPTLTQAGAEVMVSSGKTIARNRLGSDVRAVNAIIYL